MIAQPNMHRFEFKLAFLDRHELRNSGAALGKLNALGSEGWHIVHIKEDPKKERDLVIFLEREVV